MDGASGRADDVPMRRPALALLLSAIALPASAQLPPGSIGNGGRLPETMLPGALPPPPTLVARKSLARLPRAWVMVPMTTSDSPYPRAVSTIVQPDSPSSRRTKRISSVTFA